MTEHYQGMRWYKCDFQMQTPADNRHWRGAAMAATPEAKKEAALAYARRCFEVGLECICVTEHNFIGSKDFLPLLKQSISEVAEELRKDEIVLFPGFEITANVGHGCHILAIFSADSDFSIIDHKVTECGVPASRVNSSGDNAKSSLDLAGIIGVVQGAKDHKERGIVICAHPTDKNGLFDNDRISEWLQCQEWKNPELLAVEVPKPVGSLSAGWQKLFGNGADCNSDWRRARPMACVMSSDCKALTEAENPDNFIGKRHCWIKMSKPSIESLRQAFLDHASRIRLQNERPEHVHGQIETLSVKGMAFLADQTIHFSPGLNCIIGGRGSGKSSVLEYLRLVLGADRGVVERGVAESQVQRIKETMKSSSATITLDWRKESVTEKFERQGSDSGSRVIGRTVTDHQTVLSALGVQVFSQREISERSSGEASRLVSLLDSLCASGLAARVASSASAAAEVKRLLLVGDEAARHADELIQASQRTADLQRDVDAKAQVQEEGKKQRAAIVEEAHLQQLKEYVDGISALAKGLHAQLCPVSKTNELTKAPRFSGEDLLGNKNAYEQASDEIDAAIRAFSSAITSAAQEFDACAKNSLNDTLGGRLHAAFKAIAAAKTDFELSCQAKGVKPEEVERIKAAESALARAKEELTTKRTTSDKSKVEAAKINDAMTALAKQWRQETAEREKVINEILASGRIPKTSDGNPTVGVQITFAGDKSDFLAAWAKLCPDKRKPAGKLWTDGDDSIGSTLHAEFMADPGNSGNPAQWLFCRLDNHASLPTKIREHLPAIKSAIKDEAPGQGQKASWHSLLAMRTKDSADMILSRHDGSEVGSLTSGKLSEGQRNTAVLSLLLARGDGPIIIDQPEDELDSEFLFSELVPLLRETKCSRQIIVVTHNANIPVNGDAEMIYALRARSGKGEMVAQGGLDRAGVAGAVLDIMEGSPEAFRKRREKYNF
jgi:ABC-type cobalamin/Fe3+-siderophores transport system ATPase subunit